MLVYIILYTFKTFLKKKNYITSTPLNIFEWAGTDERRRPLGQLMGSRWQQLHAHASGVLKRLTIAVSLSVSTQFT